MCRIVVNEEEEIILKKGMYELVLLWELEKIYLYSCMILF